MSNVMGDCRMAQSLADDLGVNTLAKHDGRVGMSKVVEANTAQAGLVQYLPERMGECIRQKRRAIGMAENKAFLPEGDTQHQALCLPTFFVRPQGYNGNGTQGHHTPSLGCLGRFKHNGPVHELMKALSY